jgi:hypothetical protein
MYTTKNGVHRNDTGTPPPMVCKPGHFIKEVVGAGICGYWGEPLHIREMLRRRSAGTQEKVMNHLSGELENDSNLCNLMACITVSCTDTMIWPKLTTSAIALRFTANKDCIKSGRN